MFQVLKLVVEILIKMAIGSALHFSQLMGHLVSRLVFITKTKRRLKIGELTVISRVL